MKLLWLKDSIVKQTIIYTLSDGLSRGMSFITLPLISYYLIPSQLGLAANFDVFQNIIMLLAGQAIVNSLPFFYYKSSKKALTYFISSLLFLILTINIIASIIIFLTSNIIEHYLQLGLSLQLLTIISVIAHLLSSINLILYRLENKPYHFAIFQFLQTILYLTFLIILVIYFRMEAIGKIYSIVIAYTIMAIIHLVLLIKREYIKFKVDLLSIKTLLKFGLPLLPHSLSFWIKSGMDKILLTTYCGIAINGIYSMAMSFGSIYNIFLVAFNNAYVPYLQKRLSSIKTTNINDEKKNIVILSYRIAIFFIILFFLVVMLCWFFIHYYLDKKYISSFDFIPYILLSLTINSLYSLVVQFIYTAKKTFGLGIITFTGSLIQLFISYILINLYNEDGIKYSLVIGSLIIMLGVWWYSNKVYPMPWIKALKLKNIFNIKKNHYKI